MAEPTEPNLLKMTRSADEILRDVRAGALDIADVQIQSRVQIDEIDKSGDEPKLTRTRVFVDGEQTEVINYP